MLQLKFLFFLIQLINELLFLYLIFNKLIKISVKYNLEDLYHLQKVINDALFLMIKNLLYYNNFGHLI